MTKYEELAKKLDGRMIGDEITPEEEIDAEKEGLVVVFGYSDDNVELRGAIDDEIGCYDGGVIYISNDGGFSESEGTKLSMLWCKDENYSWTYLIDVPHAEFDIYEGDEKFCRGIVFNLADCK